MELTDSVKTTRLYSFITSVILTVISLTTAYEAFSLWRVSNWLFGGSKDLVDGINSVDGDSVIAGYEVVGRLAGGFLGGLAGVVVWVLCVMLAIVFVAELIILIFGYLSLHFNSKYNESLGISDSFKYIKSDAITKLVFSGVAIFAMLIMGLYEGITIFVFFPLGAVLGLSIYELVIIGRAGKENTNH